MWPDRSGSAGIDHSVATDAQCVQGSIVYKHCNVVIGLEEDPGVVSGCHGLVGSP